MSVGDPKHAKIVEMITDALKLIDELSAKENMEYMAKRNFEVWKDIYEKEYQMPLSYGENK